MMIPSWFRRLPWVSPAKRLEWFPPFDAMSIRVLVLEDDWRHVCILLPLNRFNRNPGGGMFGGAIAALADPVAALACDRVFPGHQVWTRAMKLDFRREGRTDLTLRFDFESGQRDAIATRLAARRHADPVFEYGFYDRNDALCVQVENTVAIRPGDYRSGQRKKRR